MRTIIQLVVGVVLFLTVETAPALTIIRDFIGGTPPTNSIGAGNLQTIFNVACDVWELAIRDDYTQTLHYGWANVGGGQHVLNVQGGTPNRETDGTILFNNNNQPGNYSWYLDPNPLADTGYTNWTEESASLGVRPINVTRWFKGGGKGYPIQADLFTSAMHETWHALGSSFGNTSFTNQSAGGSINIALPSLGKFAGTVVPLQTNNLGIVSHIEYVPGTSGMSLGSGSFSSGARAYPDMLSMAVVAQISGFQLVNWNLTPVVKARSYTGGTRRHPTNYVQLSWIQPLGGSYKLYQAATADAIGPAWTQLNAAQTVTNGVYSATLLATNASGFFTLVKQ